MASLQSNSSFSFKHHLTGEACLAWYLYIIGQYAEQFNLFIQTPLDRRGMASLQSNSTFSFKNHSTGEAFLAWYLYMYIIRPL